MVKIDFVPNEYIQQRQSSRANFMYLVLFMVLMGALAITFSIIKVGQIAQLEELQAKGKAMMATMGMAAELLEPVPKSVILACLTNNMPSGMSLLGIKVTAKETKAHVSRTASASQYQAATAAASASPTVSKEKLLETHIEIKGMAPSDIEVANYIARLGGSVLLENVALVESKEHKIDNTEFREFKLTTTVTSDVRLTKEDVENIRRSGN
jgi:Tfp pilus assembly protein PilN